MPRTAKITPEIVDAAIATEIMLNGLSGFTVAGVAHRAETSVQYLTRKHGDKHTLLKRFVKQTMDTFESTVPKSITTLKRDLAALLTQYDEVYARSAETALQIMAMSVRFQNDHLIDPNAPVSNTRRERDEIEQSLSEQMIDADSETGVELARFLEAHIANGNLKNESLSSMWTMLLSPIFTRHIWRAAGLGKVNSPYQVDPLDLDNIIHTFLLRYGTDPAMTKTNVSLVQSTPPSISDQGDDDMNYKELTRGWFALWNAYEFDRIGEFAHDIIDVKNFGAASQTVTTLAEMRQAMEDTVKRIPDIQFEVIDIIAEGDTCVTHWRATGTTENGSITLDGLSYAKYVDGKMKSGFNGFDTAAIA